MALFSKKTKKETTKASSAADVVLSEKSEIQNVHTDVVRLPYITEKASIMSQDNKYAFRVAPDANKIAVRKAIESMYKVAVEKVHMISIPPKARQMGRYKGHRPGFKKAIVTLKEGDKIDIFKN